MFLEAMHKKLVVDVLWGVNVEPWNERWKQNLLFNKYSCELFEYFYHVYVLTFQNEHTLKMFNKKCPIALKEIYLMELTRDRC